VGRDFFGDFAGYVTMTAMDVTDGVDQLGSQAALEQIARRARLQRAHGLGIA